MAEMTTQEQVNILTKSVGDLATVVRDVAAHVYRKEGMYGEEEEYEDMTFPEEGGMMGGEEEVLDEEVAMMGDNHMRMEDKDNDEDPTMDGSGMMKMDEDEDDEDMEKGMHKSKKVAKKKTKKGYAATAEIKADEEDSSFGDPPDSNIKGNEVSPAGEMGGDRGDETFNMKFTQDVIKELKGMKKALADSGIVVAKSIVPNPGSTTKGRTTGGKVTPDMEMEIKKRSWKQINGLREQVGDLPKYLF